MRKIPASDNAAMDSSCRRRFCSLHLACDLSSGTSVDAARTRSDCDGVSVTVTATSLAFRLGLRIDEELNAECESRPPVQVRAEPFRNVHTLVSRLHPLDCRPISVGQP